MEKGITLIETLLVIGILASLASGYSKTEEYLKTLKAHKLCSNIEFYLNNLKFIAEHKGTPAVFMAKDRTELVGVESARILFREISSPNLINLKAGIGSPDSIIFYPNNSSSPGSISIGRDINGNFETACSLSVSLRGRIRKVIYDY